MGLLPCLLRSVTSSLLLVDNLDASNLDKETRKKVISPFSINSELYMINETIGVDTSSELDEFKEYIESLLWTESILGLTMALISVTTALPALTDNGVISSIAAVLSHKPVKPNKYLTNQLINTVEKDRAIIIRLHIDSLVVQILDTAITNHSGSFVAFKDQGGAEAALMRLLDELEMLSSKESDITISDSINASITVSTTFAMDVTDDCTGKAEILQNQEKGEEELVVESIVIVNDENKTTQDCTENEIINMEIEKELVETPSPAVLNISSLEAMAAVTEGGKITILTLPPANKVLLHQLISLIISWVQDTQQDSGDHLHGQLLKGTLFAQIFGVLFKNVTVLSSALISPAVALIADIINNDPAPPGLLTHMLSGGIMELSIRACLDPTLVYGADLLMSISSLISACCLTQEGIDLVKSINPFSHLFSLLLDEKYYYPYSKTFMTDLPSNFGSSLEELIRHYPTLQSMVLNTLLQKLSDVAALALSTKTICNNAQLSFESNSTSFNSLSTSSSSLSDDIEKVK